MHWIFPMRKSKGAVRFAKSLNFCGKMSPDLPMQHSGPSLVSWVSGKAVGLSDRPIRQRTTLSTVPNTRTVLQDAIIRWIFTAIPGRINVLRLIKMIGMKFVTGLWLQRIAITCLSVAVPYPLIIPCTAVSGSCLPCVPSGKLPVWAQHWLSNPA